MSSMKKTHNLVAVVGKYTDGQGQEKNRYLTIGAAFTRDDGSMALKIECLPVVPEWNGWVNLYLPKEQQNGQRPQQQRTAQGGGGGQEAPFVDDDIPFITNGGMY